MLLHGKDQVSAACKEIVENMSEDLTLYILASWAGKVGVAAKKNDMEQAMLYQMACNGLLASMPEKEVNQEGNVN